MNQLDPKIAKKIFKNNLIITGGHFLLLPDGQANLNEGTINSFKEAAEVFTAAKKQGFQVALGILVNNMGGVCDTKKQVCVIDPEKIKEFFKLPPAYTEILKNLKIEEKEVVIYWEKGLRNVGKKQLLKQLKAKNPNIKEKEGSYEFINPADDRSIILSRANPNDKYGIAACPLIMAALVEQMKKDGFSSSLSFYYVDIENEENIPNYFAIEKGRVVAESFFPGSEVVNIYLLKDQVVTSFEFNNV